MEIAEFVRSGGSRLWLLVAIPVLAVLATLVIGLVESPAPSYRVTATVVLTPPSGATGGVVVSQAVESFRSALTTDSVTAEAAEESGVAADELRDALDSRRLGTSSVVELIYQGPRRDEAPAVLRALATAGTELAFGGELAAADQQLATAEERFDAAQAAVDAVEEETGVRAPTETLRARNAEVSQLRVAVAQARSRGEQSGPLEDALAQSEQALATLTEQVGRFEQPQFDLDRARDNLADADERVAETQNRLVASSGEASVRVSQPAEVPQTAASLRQIVAAGVIGLLIAIAVLALLEAMRGRRRPGRRSAAAPGRTWDDMAQAGLGTGSSGSSAPRQRSGAGSAATGSQQAGPGPTQQDGDSSPVLAGEPR